MESMVLQSGVGCRVLGIEGFYLLPPRDRVGFLTGESWPTPLVFLPPVVLALEMGT